MDKKVISKITDVNKKVESVTVQVTANTLEIRSIQAELNKIKQPDLIRSTGKGVVDEDLVIFVSLENMDLMTGYTRNLAERRNPDRSPNAGLRMDIPRI